ncbi:Ig-like domain-containing protein [Mycolicibacterium pulveris]|uniref:Ig-like domain-containing protein n=1 Tax=Mycolicibacterium pulveris TaxID=36813 RepID=UPI003CE81BC2
MALGVGVAVATGGSGLAWADPGSTGDAPSAGASSRDGSQTSSGQDADGNPAEPSTASDSVADDEAGGDDPLETDDPDADTSVLPDLTEDTEADAEIEIEIEAEVQDGAPEAASLEPAVSQRDSGLQAATPDEAGSDPETTGDSAPVVEDVVERDDEEVTAQPELTEPLPSEVVHVVETFVDERQVTTTLASEEPDPAPVSTGVPDTFVGVASTFAAALLSPFLAPSPVSPAEPPLAWALLALVRREWQHMLLNRTPHAVVDTVTTSEDTPITVDVITGTDPDAAAGDVVAVTDVTQPQNGTVTLQGGTLTYTPNPDFYGTDTFTYTISDEESPLHLHGLRGLWAAIFGGDLGHADTVTVTVTVTPVNDVPVAVDDAVTVGEDSGATVVDVLGNDTDVDGDELSVTAAGAAGNGTVTLIDGAVTYTPDADFHGTDSFTYTVSDGNGGTATATVTVTVTAVPDSPAPADDFYTTAEDTPLTIPAPGVLGNDVDADGDDLSVRLTTMPLYGTLVLNSDGSFTYTPNPDFHGSDSFTYAASDGNGGTATATVYVTVNPVNDAPVAVDDAVTADEDSGATVVDVLGNDTDVDGDELSLTAAGAAGNGTVTLVDGVLTYTPDTDFHGSDSFTYTISDGNGGTATATVYVTVNPVNDAPVAVDDSLTVDAHSGTIVLDVLGNDSDVDGDELSVTVALAPGYGTVTLFDGVLTYTPDANFRGTDSFTYIVSDGNGGTAMASVHVTVNPPNTAPLAGDDFYSTLEDTPLTVSAPGVLGNDVGVDGDHLVALIKDQPTNGMLVLHTDGSFIYNPFPGFYGADLFTYAVYDSDGRSATATVYLTVGQVNNPPVANDDFRSTEQDTPIVITVLDNDFDADSDSLRVILIDTPQRGDAVLNADGTITYRPAAGFSGRDTFTYQITDGIDVSDVATVQIQVRERPLAAPDIVVSTDEDNAVDIDVLVNDPRPGGHTAVDIVVVDVPANGSVSVRPSHDGGYTLTYVPQPDFSGVDSLTYRLVRHDGSVSNTATVTITVNPVNDDPVAVDDRVTVDEASTANVIDVLGNDTDVDGDALSVVEVGTAGNGTATLVDGVITYTPNADFDGTDSFTYTVSDGNGGTANATVTVTVKDADTITFDDGARPSETFLSNDESRIYVLTHNQLRIVDRATREWVGTVELGATPTSFTMSRDGRYAYVGTSSWGSIDAMPVTKIDLETGRSTLIGGVRQPTAMALSRDGDTLYVTNYQDGTVSVIDTVAGEYRLIDAGMQSSAIAVSEDNTTVYVATITNEVRAVDVATGTYNVVYEGVRDDMSVADQSITVVGNRAYVTDGINHTLAVIDTDVNEVIAVYDDVGPRPSSVAATREGDVILVSTRGDESISVVSLEYGVLGAIRVGANPTDIDFAVDSENVYVTVRDGISIVPAEEIYALFGERQL